MSNTRTEKLYLTKPDLFSHQAKVVDIEILDDKAIVQLDATIFHPKGGGQPADFGTINGVKVVDVIKAGSNTDFEIHHIFSDKNLVNFAIGDTVTLEVDPKRRHYLSQLHTAGHLISNYIQDQCGFTYEKCHLYPEKSIYLMFSRNGNVSSESKESKTEKMNISSEQVKALVNECNLAIKQDLPIREVKTENNLRGIQIGNLAPFPCGGTHTKLSEIGGIFIKKVKKEKEKGKEFIKITYDLTDAPSLKLG